MSLQFSVCGPGADVVLSAGVSNRCPGLAGETSGGFRQAEGLCGDAVGSGVSGPRSLRLHPGGAEPERDGLQRERASHGCSDG